MAKFLKLIWKGKFNDVEDLPIGELPENAVRFEEPESAEELAKETRRFLIPVALRSLSSNSASQLFPSVFALLSLSISSL